MKNQAIESKLLFAQNALTNALGPAEIKNALTLFGYDEAKLNEGKKLYEKAANLQNIQVKEYGEQYEATDSLGLARAEANKQYMVHLKIARIALKGNRNAEQSLQMGGRRNESLSGWLSQAKAFYTNALSDNEILNDFGKFGIDKKKLESAQQLVTKVENAYNKQLKEIGDAQAATVERDKALDELQEWISDFIAISRIAMEGKSQYLEVLGIVEPS